MTSKSHGKHDPTRPRPANQPPPPANGKRQTQTHSTPREQKNGGTK